MNKNVIVFSPAGYSHSQAFFDVAQGFGAAFDELEMGSKPLIFGANIAAQLGAELPENAIIYQAEQICAKEDSEWMTHAYLDLLRHHEVWDYSLNNIEALRKKDIRARHIPIGYMPCMRKIAPVDNQDIDVLIYGSMNPRRANIVDRLLALGLNVRIAFNVYGVARDNLIARSKIVLNVHYYEAAIFEIFRCSHLFANSICVVSETGRDIELETPYYAAAEFCTYNDIVDNCCRLLSAEAERRRIAQAGFDIFSSRSQTGIIKEFL